MLMNDEEVNRRLSSPLNLINRMKSASRPDTSKSAMDMFGIPKKDESPAVIPTMPPSVDDLIDNLESKLIVGQIHDKSLSVLNDTLDELRIRLPEANHPSHLSRIATDMQRIISSIHEAKNSSHGSVNQVIIYKPVIQNESHYETIHVME